MGYTKYLRYLVKDLNLESNINFLGRMSADEIAKQISVSHIVVIPSAIENAPNSLAESELVGVPTIASFVGGNMDMMTHNVDGFLYCYNEPGMLAEYVSRIFDDDKLALELSKNAHQTAMKRHDPEMLEKMLLSIYKKIE
jgi:glycosyltransferase involved in cell wall biosynthesis